MTGASIGESNGVNAGNRRTALRDVALVAGYLVLSAFGISLSLEPSYSTPIWSMLLITAGGALTLLARRRWPVVSFSAVLALMLLSFAGGTGIEVLLVIPFLYQAGVERSTRWAWLAYGITVGVVALGAGVLSRRLYSGPSLLGIALRDTPQGIDGWVSVFAPITAITVIVTLIGVNIGNRRRLVAALVERAAQMQRERDQGASIARAGERERIAREMHDVIAHSLAVMIALADGAEASAIRRPEKSQEAAARIAETGRRTLSEVRRLLGSVHGEDETTHPGATSAQLAPPTVEQIPELVSEFQAAGLAVRFEPAPLLVDPIIGFTIYRIVQESLTNVLRHAREVRDVRVEIMRSGGEITVLVEDSSAPAGLPGAPGRGLVGMRERAALYDGTVEASPRPGGGWRVFVRLPLDE